MSFLAVCWAGDPRAQAAAALAARFLHVMTAAPRATLVGHVNSAL